MYVTCIHDSGVVQNFMPCFMHGIVLSVTHFNLYFQLKHVSQCDRYTMHETHMWVELIFKGTVSAYSE